MQTIQLFAGVIFIISSGSAVAKSVVRLGGLGLVLIGLADNSVIPMPGSMDVFTIWLAAGHRHSWPYYMILATIGSIIGGYVTYHLGRKGGKEALERKFPKKKLTKLYAKFERWGFWSVVIAAMIPPPFPIAAVLLGSGAMRYSRGRFLAALSLGRGVRYAILAYLGSRYGSAVLSFFSKYYKPALVTLVTMSVIAGVYAIFKYRQMRKETGHYSGAPLKSCADSTS